MSRQMRNLQNRLDAWERGKKFKGVLPDRYTIALLKHFKSNIENGVSRSVLVDSDTKRILEECGFETEMTAYGWSVSA